jgi:hypothetical protein
MMPTNKEDHAEELDGVRIFADLQRWPDAALYSACSSVRGEEGESREEAKRIDIESQAARATWQKATTVGEAELPNHILQEGLGSSGLF